jgi:hypothetical protein
MQPAHPIFRPTAPHDAWLTRCALHSRWIGAGPREQLDLSRIVENAVKTTTMRVWIGSPAAPTP